MYFHFFFFNDTATTEIYTLSLHDALPIYMIGTAIQAVLAGDSWTPPDVDLTATEDKETADLVRRLGTLTPQQVRVLMMLSDRKSTRLNSSHANISYAVFCLKKKKTSCKQ